MGRKVRQPVLTYAELRRLADANPPPPEWYAEDFMPEDERIPPRTQLPFKLNNNGRGNTVTVEWVQTIDTNAGKKTIPMLIEVDAGPQAHLGSRIRELMEMYWKIEGERSAVLKERDAAAERADKAEGLCEKLRRELEGLRRQQKGEK